jgi:hypothetical protein
LEQPIKNSTQGPQTRILRTKSIDIKYNTPRPLYEWKSDDLLRLAENGLTRPWPALELPSLALIEIGKRHRSSDYKLLIDLFKIKKITPIFWLDSLNSILRQEAYKTYENNRGSHDTVGSIYAVLIQPQKSGLDHKLYIGSSVSKDFGHYESNQEKVIASQFEGLEGSFDCKLFGIEPIWSVSALFSNTKLSRKQLLVQKSKIHTLAKTKVSFVLGERPYLEKIKVNKTINSLLEKEK